MTFIRGPVCKGQIALNVIQDHFWVAFMDPKYDLSIQDKYFFYMIIFQIFQFQMSMEKTLAYLKLLKLWTIMNYQKIPYK